MLLSEDLKKQLKRAWDALKQPDFDLVDSLGHLVKLRILDLSLPQALDSEYDCLKRGEIPSCRLFEFNAGLCHGCEELLGLFALRIRDTSFDLPESDVSELEEHI